MSFAPMLVFCIGLAVAQAPSDTTSVSTSMRLATDPHSQNWRHDAGHVISTAILTPAVYGLSLEAGASRTQARWIAAGTMVVAMVLKEWHDYRAVGNFSGRDIGFGVAGTAAGFYIAERISWSPRAPTGKDQR